jgi:HD-GYP domain-containing protein (c-di-GMP phosphodiesterase class II)
MPGLTHRLPKDDAIKLGILERVWSKVRPEERRDELFANVMAMATHALDASAALLLFIDDETRELYFKLANDLVGGKLKHLHLERMTSITEWILKNGKPLMINDPEKVRRYYRLIDRATGFKTRAVIGVPIMMEGKTLGVIEVLNKHDVDIFTHQDLKTVKSVAGSIAMAIEHAKMNVDLMDSYKTTVKALVSLADAKETSGGGHSRRVTEYALLGATELKLSRNERRTIEYAAILHDIGKLAIPDSILNKATPLTEAEWAKIRKHPLVGYNLLKEIPFLKEASKLILYHHERYDGKGYPTGISGEAMSMGARLIAVADAFDNMTTDHPYRKAMRLQKAFNELRQGAGTQFCPVAVKAFNAGFVRTRLHNKQTASTR